MKSTGQTLRPINEKRMLSVFPLVISVFLCTGIFSSCSSIYRLSIEVQEPAKITFPVLPEGLIIVDNSIAQEKGFGMEYYFDKKEFTPGIQLDMDSIGYFVTKMIAGMINDRDFFPFVGIYKQNTRDDNNWFQAAQLTEEKRNEIFGQTDADVIISINRVLVNLNHKVLPRYPNDSDPVVNIRSGIRINCSAFLKENGKTLTNFELADSLILSDWAIMDTFYLYRYLPTSLIQETAEKLCGQIVDNFTPSWKVTDRIIYTNNGSRMTEALAFFKKDNWLEAIEIWNQLYTSEKNNKKKARLAINIAVAHEIQDQLEDALSLALVAKENYKITGENENSDEIQWGDTYIQLLEKRINQNNILDFQYGEE